MIPVSSTAPRLAAEARIAVSIVNYRSADLVMRGLPTLIAELDAFADGMVVIVDNASPGDDADRLEAFLRDLDGASRVRLVRSPRNGGFAAGNNLAFAAVAEAGFYADAVLLLNPDGIIRPGAVRILVETLLERPEAGVVGAGLDNEDGSPSGAAFTFPSAMGEFAAACGLGVALKFWPVVPRIGDGPTRVDWVTGAAMLIRSEMLNRIGGMDEEYFLYYEEVDFMLKAARGGWEIWHDPRARVLHLAGGSTGVVDGKATQGRMPAYWFESWLRYFSKNHGAGYARLAALTRLAGVGLGRVVRRLRGRVDGLPPRYMRDFSRGCLFGRIGGPREESP